ncbi:unnamed protein product (macronuclear) [Paramecium tetraurelia]|uniref:Calcineurin-like phosphoesterase domain-containing protein n=1 Tax=Paramecium tetraurelia TaxID=5888 RepID=A0CCW2_PARTE|nr:uncharacterized protein GSPATT00037414001 [Paramecium tetraurelia]CAK68629.1 unnamed protein product [Paramecium tetraurelia]|eukprot:XP_001436026.1 hypothetical protein (macronuclear) [Paramecium tetraurelia strain d4-2]
MDNPLTFVCISDTHSRFIEIPQGDVFIHCGDFSTHGEYKEVEVFIDWIKALPFKYKVVIAGNHDIFLDIEKYEKQLRDRFHKRYAPMDHIKLKEKLKQSCIYLENSSVVIEGYKIWGSPYSPTIPFNPWAFQVDEEDGEEFWKIMEEGSDIVLTHGAPLGHSSYVSSYEPTEGEWGDQALANRIKEVKPLYHIFGHVHEGYGMTEENGTKYINCAILDERYKLAEKAYVFQLPRRVVSENESIKQQF